MSDHELKRRDGDVGALARWLKALAGVIASIAVLAGAFTWAADTRYAQKVDVVIAVQSSADRQRGLQVEDKIFEINLIPPDKRSDVQRALLDRYLREAEALKSKKQ